MADRSLANSTSYL